MAEVLGKRAGGAGEGKAADELPTLNAEEAQLYDRQIRLWGVEAQSRMRRSRVLLAGVGGLVGEAAKNLVLAGVGTAYLLDGHVVQAQDLAAQFFITPADVGSNRAEASLERLQELNPRVNVVADPSPLDSKDAAFFQSFDIVCLSENPDLELTMQINEWCRDAKVPFFCGDLQGLYGYIFMDHNGHRYTEKVTEKTRKQRKGDEDDELVLEEEEEVTVNVEGVVASPSLKEALRESNWASRKAARVTKHFYATAAAIEYCSAAAKAGSGFKGLEEFHKEYVEAKSVDATFVPLELTKTLVRCHCADLNPVAAIVGGILGQEVIKVLSAKSKPLLNFFLFDGATGPGVIEFIEPASAEASAAAKAAASAPPADIICL